MILATALANFTSISSNKNKIIVALLFSEIYNLQQRKNWQAGIELDTDYNRQIYKSEIQNWPTGTNLDLGRASHSSMFWKTMVFEYTKRQPRKTFVRI